MVIPKKALAVKQPPGFKLYSTIVPLILLVISVLLFCITAMLTKVWEAGWIAACIVALLSLETVFLPFLLFPLAIWLPTLLPWPTYDLAKEFSIDGCGRLPQRILLGGLILLPGLPVLSAYDSHAVAMFVGGWAGCVELLFTAGVGTVIVFVILTAVLTIPDFSNEMDRD